MQRTIQDARAGKHGPVHVLAGPESFLIERAVGLLRVACLGEGPDGFNDERFHGKGLAGQTVVSAARTLPMMAKARFVLVRDADAMAPSELDALSGYLEDPAPSTCLVLTATKLDGRMRITKLVKKRGYLADAKPLKPAAAMQFARGEAKRRGHELDPRAADALESAVGTDLSAMDDALERLSLFVGDGAPIDEAAVEACVTRVRAETIWALVDSVGLKRPQPTLAAAASLLAAREPPLRVLAMVARQLRMVAKMREALTDGQTVMFVIVEGRVAGLIGVADPIKETTPEAIRSLHQEGIRIVMLTGDSRSTAEAVAGKLDIDEVVAEVLPDQKAEVIKRFQSEGHIVAMAGDGINDAPALAQAQVGIAMGTGTDVAMESAGVTLVRGDFRGIVQARRLSRATMNNIKQNLFFAFAYNSLGIPIAAGVLYPFFGILLSPMIAAAAMSFSSVSVIGNALRLRTAKV